MFDDAIAGSAADGGGRGGVGGQPDDATAGKQHSGGC